MIPLTRCPSNLERSEDLEILLDGPSQTPQLYCNNLRVASSTKYLEFLLEDWFHEYGSIQNAYTTMVKSGLCSDSRLRVPTQGVPTQGNIVLSPSPEEQYQLTMIGTINVVQVTRDLIRLLPSSTLVLHKKKQYHQCFMGRDLKRTLRDWLKLSPGETKNIGQQLLDVGVVELLQKRSSDDESIYRLQALEKNKVLNCICPLFTVPPVETTHAIIINLSRILDETSRNHSGEMATSNGYLYFQEQVAILRGLRFPAKDPICLVNLYNLMIRHALIECEWGRKGHWQTLLTRTSYHFAGDNVVTLADITNSLANPSKKGFLSFLSMCRPQVVDPRYEVLCSRGTMSSPEISVYETETDIDTAVRDYVQNSIRIDQGQLSVPQIFAVLFQTKHDLLAWLVQYLDGPTMYFVAENHAELVVKYQHYDWAPRKRHSSPHPLSRRKTMQPVYSRRNTVTPRRQGPEQTLQRHQSMRTVATTFVSPPVFRNTPSGGSYRTLESLKSAIQASKAEANPRRQLFEQVLPRHQSMPPEATFMDPPTFRASTSGSSYKTLESLKSAIQASKAAMAPRRHVSEQVLPRHPSMRTQLVHPPTFKASKSGSSYKTLESLKEAIQASKAAGIPGPPQASPTSVMAPTDALSSFPGMHEIARWHE